MKLRKIACNGSNSIGINRDGQVMAWGSGKYGLLGDGETGGQVSTPIILPNPSQEQ
jgi:alpha-tubulin suppressor-like RCC1 family protein